MPQHEPIFIAGPTGVGKSEVALRLAQLLPGEIVSVDSMQVYRGLDIGTAKPSQAERALVPHYLVDVAELDRPFDASQFVQLARRAVEEIQSRGHVPIFCGGTGLYFKAYLEGVGEGPPADPALRAEIEAIPLPELLAELERADRILFRKIDLKNRRRIVRAVEVIRLTGRPFSEQQAEWKKGNERQRPGPFGQPPDKTQHIVSTVQNLGAPTDRPLFRPARSTAGRGEFSAPPSFFLGLQRAPEDLRERIDRRVDAMFERGLVAETERLLARGLEHNRTAMQAIGYRQIVEHLRGERSLPETISLVKQKTRQFAKRQMTWFRNQLPVQWLELAAGTAAEDVARQIEAMAAGARGDLSSLSSPSGALDCGGPQK